MKNNISGGRTEKMSNEKTLQAPGGFGTRHYQTLITALSLFVAYSMRHSISVAIVAMTDKSTNQDFRTYDWNAKEKSLILSSFLWGYTIAHIPSGYLAGIWSAQKLFSIGFFLSGIVHLLIPFLADHGGWIAVCTSRVAMGLVQACMLPSWHTLVAKWTPPQERSRLTTYIASGGTFGTVAAMLVTGYIAASPVGWPGIYYIFGSLTIFTSVIFYFNTSDSPSDHPTISEEERNYINESLWREHPNSDNQLKLSPPWKKILTSMPMWAIIVAHCGSNWGSITLQTQMPAYVKSILKFDIAEVGIISSLYYVAAWLACYPFSWLADYAICRGLSVSWTRRIFNSIGLWIPAALMIALCFVDQLKKAWPVGVLILTGSLKAAVSAGCSVNHIDLSPNFAGSMYAVSNCLAALIGMLAPIFCGAIVNDSVEPGRWHLVFYVIAAVYFCTNLFYILFARGKIQSWNSSKRRLSVISLPEPNPYILEP